MKTEVKCVGKLWHAVLSYQSSSFVEMPQASFKEVGAVGTGVVITVVQSIQQGDKVHNFEQQLSKLTCRMCPQRADMQHHICVFVHLSTLVGIPEAQRNSTCVLCVHFCFSLVLDPLLLLS